MSNAAADQTKAPEIHYVTHQDLPLSCPTPEMTLWNMHPRVYLPIEKSGESVCPYCSAKYVLQTPAKK